MDDVAALSDFINLYLMPGLVVGCIYALGAIGISLLFGILRFAHFAHGDMMTLGAYLAIIFTANFGWSPYAALPIAIVGTAIIALGLDRAFYKPFRRSPGIVTVIASFGVMLMLRSAIQLIWGVDVKTYYSGIVFPMQFGMIPERESFVRYRDRLQAREAYKRANEIDEKIIAETQAQPPMPQPA